MAGVLRSSLTVEDLREFVRAHLVNIAKLEGEEYGDLRASIRDPSLREGILRFALGVDVAVNLLGSIQGVSTTLSSLASPAFFGSLGGIVPQYRVERFGEALFNLQSVPGFRSWLADFPVVPESELASMLEGRFAEADAAGLMYRAGVLRALRVRKNRPRDYDCDLMIDGVAVAAEIKAKVEATPLSPVTIQRTIERARDDQLPSDGPGIVWLKLPHSWVGSPVAQLNLDVAMTAVRESSSHMIAVVTHWEQFDGLVALVMFNVMPCTSDPSGDVLVRSLDAALESLPEKERWVHLRSVVHDSLGSSAPPREAK